MLLPLPEGPTRAVTLPAGIEKDTSLITSSWLYPKVTFFSSMSYLDTSRSHYDCHHHVQVPTILFGKAKKTIFKFRRHITKRLSGQAGTSQCRHSMRQKFVFTPFQRMLHQKDRQKRLPFFYRNNTKKYGGIVPNIVPNIVPIELQKPLFYAAVGKEKILSTRKTILALLTNRLS